MKKFYQIIPVVLFAAALFVTPVCFFLQEDKEFSESENRYLATKPAVSFLSILSGEFMKDAEEYIDDQLGDFCI